MSLATLPTDGLTAQELADRVGAIPLSRILANPTPGTATEEDVERLRHDENRICELIDGVLVEKAVNDETSVLAGQLITLLNNFVLPRRMGWILGPDGFVRLFGTQLRAPDVSFIRRDQRPDGRPLKQGYSETAPMLAIEVFSPGNTIGEMHQKREEFFTAGTETFWIVYPHDQSVEVSTGPDSHHSLHGDDVIDGGNLLPGFSIPVKDIFANLDFGPVDDASSMPK